MSYSSTAVLIMGEREDIIMIDDWQGCTCQCYGAYTLEARVLNVIGMLEAIPQGVLAYILYAWNFGTRC